jgi:hypothetical protein
MGKTKIEYTYLVGKSEWRRPVRRPRRRREGKINMNIKEIEWQVAEWINLAWNKD